MAEKKPTVKQHYVPQCYLKGFSIDGEHLYRYPLNDLSSGGTYVPIKSVLFKKNLYEFYNENGEFIARNYIENCFTQLEGMFATYLCRILQKAYNPRNYKSNCFFSPEEKSFWLLYSLLQILRSPEVIEHSTAYAKAHLDASEIISANFTKRFLLPFFEDSELNESLPLYALLQKTEDCAICIGHDRHGSLFTSDWPVFGWCETDCGSDFNCLAFPLKSDLAIFFIPRRILPSSLRNAIFDLSDAAVQFLKENIVLVSRDCILSSHKLNKQDLALIRNVENSDDKKRQLNIWN